MSDRAVRVVGELGGTNFRLARLDRVGRPDGTRTYPSAAFPSVREVLRRFLADEELEDSPLEGLALAVAGPVNGDEVAITNLHWRFSLVELATQFGFARCVALNDFEALALGLAALEKREKLLVKEGSATASAPFLVLGPGTGLGVAAGVPGGDRLIVVSGEGGHRDLAASDEEEWRIIQRLRDRFGHVSAERVLSGPGLENLYSALADDGAGNPALGAEEVSRLARDGDPHARSATRLFSAWLGAFAGDLALTFGARGGVYLAGGVVAGLGTAFDESLFQERFLAKGRMRPYLDPIPVWRIVRPDAALFGCARALLASG